MPVEQAQRRLDRRGRSVRGSSGLLERDTAVQAIEETLEATQAGNGTALLLEGHAGMGKTRLHEAALDRARALGLRVLRAAGSELECNLAFGVAGRLLSALLTELPERRRRELLTGAPDRIRVSAGAAPEPGHAAGVGDLSLSHALFTLLAAAGENQPTLIAIDDLHWCDAASLEFVLYLLHRHEELPVAIVMSRRPSTREGTSECLDRIAAHDTVRIESLRPLGAGAVAELVRRALGARADRAVIDACCSATTGNPFYLHELLIALAEEPQLAGDGLLRRAQDLAPDAVTRSLRVRVGRLGASAASLARAVAILDDDAPLRHAAALAGLDLPSAAQAADQLASVEVLLAREPLRYVHPLVRHAIKRDVPASEQASRHLDAARLLYADGAASERVAAHCLLGRAEGNHWVVGQLQAAAGEAMVRGAAQSAVSYLERALEEPPASELRAEVLAELGRAEAALGLSAAVDHLRAAAAGTPDPVRRAELARQQGDALYAQGLHAQAAAAYDGGLGQLDPEPTDPEVVELHDALQTGYIATASLVPGLRRDSVRRSASLLARAGAAPRTHGERMLLAQAAMHSVLAGAPAEVAVEMAERSWDEGRLMERETAEGVAWSLVAATFTLSGRLERSIEMLDVVLADARRRSSPRSFATASFCRALPRLWQGRVPEALAEVESALDARRYGWRQFGRAACAVQALCLIETGELERAEYSLLADGPLDAPRDLEDAFRLSVLSELRLAQGRPKDALDDALATGRAIGTQIKVYGRCPWRTVAAQAAVALGQREQALELCDEALAISEQTGVVHARIQALRVLGLSEQGERQIACLERAVELGGSGPPRLETVRALVDLGASLRRANRRAEARVPLQQAADLARAGGATALSERARMELAATGARPRREALLSGPASLTPSERRIAEHAATGQTNREIALALFVTPKTVEYHLRNVYRKLDIETRRELSHALRT